MVLSTVDALHCTALDHLETLLHLNIYIYIYIYVCIYIYLHLYTLVQSKVDALQHLETLNQLYLNIDIYMYTLQFCLQLMHCVMWRHCIICAGVKVCIQPRPASQISMASDKIISLNFSSMQKVTVTDTVTVTVHFTVTVKVAVTVTVKSLSIHYIQNNFSVKKSIKLWGKFNNNLVILLALSTFCIHHGFQIQGALYKY